MAQEFFTIKRVQGISTYSKESVIPDQVYFCRSIDYRSDPQQMTLLPATEKISGSVVTSLPKWNISEPFGIYDFYYDESGNIYRTMQDTGIKNLHTVANSAGQGMAFYNEDNYLYYTSEQTIGRYGPVDYNYLISVLGGTEYGTFSDDFMGAAGGVPTNTYSLAVASASSQYADRADTASLSITGNLTLEAYFKATTLPTSGNSMALISKWDESGATRSYKMDIYAASGYFGDGSDGALTIAADTTDAPIDSACTGTSGTTTLTATNVSFAAGQLVLIHQTQGTSAGTWMRNKISGYTAGTITLENPLTFSPTTGAQAIVMKQYTTVTVNSGKTWSAKAWNGTVGGILCFVANSSVSIAGTINVKDKGFRGPTTFISSLNAIQYSGEGTTGPSVQTMSANGNGGGGGQNESGAGGNNQNGGAAGGNSAAGGNGARQSGSAAISYGGAAAGTADLTTMVFGGASGKGGTPYSLSSGDSADGANGAGIVFITGLDVTVTGSINANGTTGNNGYTDGSGSAGGSVLIKCQTATLGTGLITATGGSGYTATAGNGADGRIHIDYYTSYTGTTSPTINATIDNSLVTSVTYQARLHVSSTGNNTDILSKNISITTNTWYRLSISWTAASKLATFYLDAVNLGTYTGTLTAINDNASRFGVAMYRNGAGTATGFFDGKIDDVRVWNTVQSDSLIYTNNQAQLVGTEAGLQAYYEFNNAYTDLTANANTLTASGAPTFSTDVPYPAPTTRQDIDQSSDTTGNTYTVPSAISEAATDRKTITPGHDPIKSISLKVSTGTSGTLTITVHDQQNRTVATGSLTNVGTGYTEIAVSNTGGSAPWSPTIGNSYHFHVTKDSGTPALTTTSANDLETVGFYTYFAYLMYDGAYHAILPMLNLLVFCNGRYLATLEGIIYQPNRITFGSEWKARCLAHWREYLAVGCIHESQYTTSAPFTSEKGRIYFWDGISTTFNFFVDIPEGGVNSMIGTRGELHIIAGNHGDHLKYMGGDKAQKIRRFPKIKLNNYMEVSPSAMTMYRGLIHYGASILTDSTTIEQGVYSYGTLDELYPETLSYDYPISTGSRASTGVRIGFVSTQRDHIHIGWQDGVACGIDRAGSLTGYATSGTIEYLIRDEDQIWKDQKLTMLRGDFLPLVSGESINIKIQNDRSGQWVQMSSAYSTVGGTKCVLPLSASRNREYQLGVDLYGNGTTTPTFLGISGIIDKQEEENAFGNT